MTTTSTSAPATPDLNRFALQRRVESLRFEIRATEKKLPRVINSLNARRRLLSQLEAKLLLTDEPRPSPSKNE